MKKALKLYIVIIMTIISSLILVSCGNKFDRYFIISSMAYHSRTRNCYSVSLIIEPRGDISVNAEIKVNSIKVSYELRSRRIYRSFKNLGPYALDNLGYGRIELEGETDIYGEKFLPADEWIGSAKIESYDISVIGTVHENP